MEAEALNKTGRFPQTENGKRAARIFYSEMRQRAVDFHRQESYTQAIEGYRLCLRINPQDAGLWSNLGAALRKLKRYQLAVACYRSALEIKPEDKAALGNLANVLKDLHRLDEANTLHAKLVSRSPSDVQTLMNAACSLRESGRFAEALTLLDSAQTIEPHNAGIEWERAQNLLHLERFEEGWDAYEARWKTGDLPVRCFPYPQWRGEILTAKRILLHSEQGYGDTLLAARFIPLLKSRGAEVVLQCKQELHRVLAHCGADRLMATDSATGHAVKVPKGESFDFHVPLMSIMGPLAIKADNIPPPVHIATTDEARRKFHRLSHHRPATLKVGVVWSGSVTFKNNNNRSLTIEDFLPFAEIPKTTLYSLQKGPCEQALKKTGADCIIENLGCLCEDFADTAAAIEQLDVIVMTDSSVAHLAASMNKPVINLLQAVPYWFYSSDFVASKWYPSMRLIRQAAPGEWGEVLAQAKTFLQEMSQEKINYLQAQNKITQTNIAT